MLSGPPRKKKKPLGAKKKDWSTRGGLEEGGGEEGVNRRGRRIQGG